jgi:hypothetical protein
MSRLLSDRGSCRRYRAPRGACGRALATGLLLSLVGTSALADGQHTIGPSYQLTIINTKQGNESVLQSPGISYVATVGGAWGFQTDFTVFFPVSAYQNGTHVDIGSTYTSAWGIDVVFAAMRRLCFQAGLQLDIGLGPHFNGVSMKGQRIGHSGFSDFNSFIMGVGMNAVLRWRVGTGPVSVGAFGSGAVDFLDLLHGGDLSLGFGVTTGAVVGVDL